MSIVVFGSINMDLVARVPRLPTPGETLGAHTFFTAPGGKGANQAVGAARLGVPTRMVGRVGDDGFGRELRRHLQQMGVQVDNVLIDPDTSSGIAIIALDDHAENSIIIASGANGRLDMSDVDRLNTALADADILLLQLEVPLEATIAAAKAARERRVTVILDPAPARPLSDEIYATIDIITPNEIEAAQLVDFPVSKEFAQDAARVLREKGAQTAIIKLGEAGAYYSSSQGEGFLEAFKVEAIDTVAAGDAFNAGLAVALHEGKSLSEAVRWGSAVGALSTTREGAQPSMPSRAEVDSFLSAHGSG